MKPLLMLAISLFFNAFSASPKADFIGKYMSNKEPDYLQLKKGGAFIYEFRTHHLYKHSTGKWQMIGKGMITLASDIHSTSIDMSLSEHSNAGSCNQITNRVVIYNGDSVSNYRCSIYINDKFYKNIRCDSISSLSVCSPINIIQYIFSKEPKVPTNTYISTPLLTKKYFLKKDGGNDIDISISFRDVYFYYKVFANDTVKINKNSIKLYDHSAKEWKKLQKVSDKTSLFSRYNDTSELLNTF